MSDNGTDYNTLGEMPGFDTPDQCMYHTAPGELESNDDTRVWFTVPRYRYKHSPIIPTVEDCGIQLWSDPYVCVVGMVAQDMAREAKL